MSDHGLSMDWTYMTFLRIFMVILREIHITQISLQDSIFPYAAICRQYSSFIMHELYEGLRSRSIKLIGKVGECKCPKVIMPLTVEPSKPRLCHDERFVNLWIKDCPFQLETLKDVHRLVERDSKMIACDEKSGYSHLSITDSSQTYFGFQFGGWLFCYATLPFGFKAAALLPISVR